MIRQGLKFDLIKVICHCLLNTVSNVADITLHYSAEIVQQIKFVMLSVSTIFYVGTHSYYKSSSELIGTCILLAAKNSCIKSIGNGSCFKMIILHTY